MNTDEWARLLVPAAAASGVLKIMLNGSKARSKSTDASVQRIEDSLKGVHGRLDKIEEDVTDTKVDMAGVKGHLGL